MVSTNAGTAIIFALSPGNAHDAPPGRALLEALGPMPEGLPLLMDRAHEGNETRQLALNLGMFPWCLRSRIGSIRGSMIVLHTRSEMRSNAFSGDSKASAVSSPASRNSISSFSHFLLLSSSSRRYVSVNTP